MELNPNSLFLIRVFVCVMIFKQRLNQLIINPFYRINLKIKLTIGLIFSFIKTCKWWSFNHSLVDYFRTYQQLYSFNVHVIKSLLYYITRYRLILKRSHNKVDTFKKLSNIRLGYSIEKQLHRDFMIINFIQKFLQYAEIKIVLIHKRQKIVDAFIYRIDKFLKNNIDFKAQKTLFLCVINY